MIGDAKIMDHEGKFWAMRPGRILRGYRDVERETHKERERERERERSREREREREREILHTPWHA